MHTHTDTLTADAALSLQQVIDAAMARHPDRELPQSVTREAEALSRRGDALLAAPPAAAVTAWSDRPTDNRGATEIEAGLELPLWRPGERAAARELANHAGAERIQVMLQGLRRDFTGSDIHYWMVPLVLSGNLEA